VHAEHVATSRNQLHECGGTAYPASRACCMCIMRTTHIPVAETCMLRVRIVLRSVPQKSLNRRLVAQDRTPMAGWPIERCVTAISRQSSSIQLGSKQQNKERICLPLGMTHTPPLLIANCVVSAPLPPAAPGAPISTITLPSWTKKHCCIFREFFARLKPFGGISTTPLPKNGRVRILA